MEIYSNSNNSKKPNATNTSYKTSQPAVPATKQQLKSTCNNGNETLTKSQLSPSNSSYQQPICNAVNDYYPQSSTGGFYNNSSKKSRYNSYNHFNNGNYYNNFKHGQGFNYYGNRNRYINNKYDSGSNHKNGYYNYNSKRNKYVCCFVYYSVLFTANCSRIYSFKRLGI
jgi:hypothetical protein